MPDRPRGLYELLITKAVRARLPVRCSTSSGVTAASYASIAASGRCSAAAGARWPSRSPAASRSYRAQAPRAARCSRWPRRPPAYAARAPALTFRCRSRPLLASRDSCGLRSRNRCESASVADRRRLGEGTACRSHPPRGPIDDVGPRRHRSSLPAASRRRIVGHALRAAAGRPAGQPNQSRSSKRGSRASKRLASVAAAIALRTLPLGPAGMGGAPRRSSRRRARERTGRRAPCGRR
jgi:hypothetical protein